MTDGPIVIVGGGQAGGQAAATLRDEGYGGPLAIVAAEVHPPYERPPLSKELLLGTKDASFCYLRGEAFWREQRIDVHAGRRAVRLDRAAHRLELDDGAALPYAKLLLGTGSRVRRLAVPGQDLPGVLYLRTLDDALDIARRLDVGAKVAVVGGGYIGLEVAASARMRGAEVTVLEAASELMSRAVAPEVAQILRRCHERQGVQIRTGALVTRFEGDGRLEAVITSAGERVPATVAVVGVGVVPETSLAAEAGLAIEDGVVVDACGRTSDPDVFAAGDVTNRPLAGTRQRVRLESWQNAQNQAIAAARAMCGRHAPDLSVPWFSSHQFGLDIQMLGVPERGSVVVFRGDVDAPACTAFYVKGSKLVAVNAINSPREVRPTRKLMERNVEVSATVLADARVELASLLARSA